MRSTLQGPANPSSEMTTHISSDIAKLYERAFFSEYKQTASSMREIRQEASYFDDAWRRAVLTERSRFWYDPTIIRFYEDIISELQRELSRYKGLVYHLLATGVEETGEETYVPGPVTRLPPDIEQRIHGKTKSGLSLLDYEI